MNLCPVRRRSLLQAAVSLPFAVGTPAARSQDSPLLVCMPVGVGSGHDLRTPRIRAGALTCFKRFNASGGVNGRSIELITLDDDGTPGKLATLLREIARQRNVLAVMGTLGERASDAAAEVANDLRMPLVAPLSGKESLTRSQNPSVFRLRPDYGVEAAALATQLRGMGCSHVALIHDAGPLEGSGRSIVGALEQSGLRVSPLALDLTVAANSTALMKSLSQGGFQAAVINLGPSAVAQMFEQGLGERTEWPGIIAAISSGDPSSLLGVFRRRDVAFTAVVPHPEVLTRRLAREFNDDIDKHGSGLALSFEGLESYLGARLVVEALRKLPGARRPVAQDLHSVLGAHAMWDILDFRLNFGKGRATGSDWASVVMRTRNGRLIATTPAQGSWLA